MIDDIDNNTIQSTASASITALSTITTHSTIITDLSTVSTLITNQSMIIITLSLIQLDQ